MTFDSFEWIIGLTGGLLMVLLMGALAVVGTRRQGHSGRAGMVMALGFGIYAIVFGGLMLSYRRWATMGMADLVFGVPAPTLWLLLGVWQLPWLLVFALMWRYEQWTLDPNDLVRFQKLVETGKLRDADQPEKAAL